MAIDNTSSLLCDDDGDGDKEDDEVSDDDNASDEDDEDLPHRLLAIAKGGRVDLEAPDARGVEQERVRLAHLEIQIQIQILVFLPLYIKRIQVRKFANLHFQNYSEMWGGDEPF